MDLLIVANLIPTQLRAAKMVAPLQCQRAMSSFDPANPTYLIVHQAQVQVPHLMQHRQRVRSRRRKPLGHRIRH